MVIAAAGGKVRDVPWPFVAGVWLLGVGVDVVAAAMGCLGIGVRMHQLVVLPVIGRGAGSTARERTGRGLAVSCWRWWCCGRTPVYRSGRGVADCLSSERVRRFYLSLTACGSSRRFAVARLFCGRIRD